jgi:hypothetical protein
VAKIAVLGVLLPLAIATSAVAAEAPLTLTVEPRIVTFASQQSNIVLSGTLLSGRAGEEVVIEAQECGVRGFVPVRREQTGPGGAWHTSFAPVIKTTYRARWGTTRTPAVDVLVRPAVRFDQGSPNRFSVYTVAYRFFNGAKGRLERFDSARGRWLLVRRVTLRRGSAPRGASWAYSGADFTARLARGTLVRFVVPRDQVGPCYLAGHSLQFNVR